MGIRQRVVQQTITEYVCDVCKEPVPQSDARVGTLAVKPAGARGRARQLDVAFHSKCFATISSSAGRGGATKRKKSQGSPARKSKATNKRRKKSASK